MAKFEYKGRSAESIRERASQSAGDYDDFIASSAVKIKIKEGVTTLRILPPAPQFVGKQWGDQWGYSIWVHSNIGPDNGSFLCPAKMKDEACPICDSLRDLDLEDQKEVKAKKRVLAYVIDRDNEKDGPLLWNMGWPMERDLQTRSEDRKTGEAILIDHPDDGYDISFKRVGTRLNTKYEGVEVDRDKSYISQNQKKQDAWLEYVAEHPIPELLVYHDYEYIEKVFQGKSAKDRSDARDKRGRDDDRGREDRSSERSRDREDPPRRSREPDSREDDRGGKRGRDREEPEDRPRRSGRDAPDDDELPSDREMRENSDRARSRSREPEDDRGTERSRGRDREEPEDPPRRSREDREEPEDRGRGRERDEGRGRERDRGEDRGRSREPEPEEDPPAQTQRARASVERLKPNNKSGKKK